MTTVRCSYQISTASTLSALSPFFIHFKILLMTLCTYMRARQWTAVLVCQSGSLIINSLSLSLPPPSSDWHRYVCMCVCVCCRHSQFSCGTTCSKHLARRPTERKLTLSIHPLCIAPPRMTTFNSPDHDHWWQYWLFLYVCPPCVSVRTQRPEIDIQ